MDLWEDPGPWVGGGVVCRGSRHSQKREVADGPTLPTSEPQVRSEVGPYTVWTELDWSSDDSGYTPVRTNGSPSPSLRGVKDGESLPGPGRTRLYLWSVPIKITSHLHWSPLPTT